jgi:hypothetical protein
MKSLGADVCELLRGADPNQAQVSVVDGFMKVLADVDSDALRTFSAANDVVAPFSAGIVVLVDRGPGLWGKPRAEGFRAEGPTTAAWDAE